MSARTLRRDRALILARGESRRMGRPKGACRFQAGGPDFLTLIVDLYLSRNMPISIISTADLRITYAALCDPGTVEWIEYEPGGDTAASVIAAVQRMADLPTHLWLHPVDLPRVCRDTVDFLLQVSRQKPESIIIPAFEKQRGHPVVLPLLATADLISLDPADYPGPMRNYLHEFCRSLHILDIPDQGVVSDYNTPEELIDDGSNL